MPTNAILVVFVERVHARPPLPQQQGTIPHGMRTTVPRGMGYQGRSPWLVRHKAIGTSHPALLGEISFGVSLPQEGRGFEVNYKKLRKLRKNTQLRRRFQHHVAAKQGEDYVWGPGGECWR